MSRLAHGAAVVALLVSTGVARAQDAADHRWRFDLSVPVELIGGYTRYTISDRFGDDSFTSELEFPIQGVMAGLRGRLLAPRSADHTQWVFDLGVLHTLTEETGTVEDSDWIEGPSEALPPPDGVGARHDGKDIYSTSKGFLRALSLDVRASWEHEVLSPAFRLAPFAGVMYQSLSYVVVDVNQIGYGPYAAGYTGRVSGRVATYDVGYRAIYLGVRGQLEAGPLTAVLDAWGSPFARASDEDDHLLRGKRSQADADGSAFQLRGEGRVALGPLDAVSIQAAVVRFATSGTQDQFFYDGSGVSFTGIPAKLVSLRWSAGVAYTRRFR